MNSNLTYLKRKTTNWVMSRLSLLFALLTLLPLALIFFYLLSKGVSALNLDFLTHLPKPVGEPGGGMANAIVGTLILVGLACLLGLPIGILAGVYLAEFGHNRFGLLVRFYLERLRLLLVPRLTAILILVVLLMAAVSVLSNRLGLEVGLSVALFPMVIMAMTIERMSVAWDERGAGTAIREGIGTLVVAALAYVVMSWQPLEHLVFVYPEVLLILFALALVLGRYSGYRLNELLRFRALARDPDPIVPPPAKPEPETKA